jgi:hypothetical protein
VQDPRRRRRTTDARAETRAVAVNKAAFRVKHIVFPRCTLKPHQFRRNEYTVITSSVSTLVCTHTAVHGSHASRHARPGARAAPPAPSPGPRAIPRIRIPALADCTPIAISPKASTRCRDHGAWGARRGSPRAMRRGAARRRAVVPCTCRVPQLAAACVRSRAHPHGMARGTRHCDSRLRCPFFVAASTRRRCGDRTQWPAAHRKVSNRADRIEVVDRTIGGVRSRPSSLHITEVRDRLHGKK